VGVGKRKKWWWKTVVEVSLEVFLYAGSDLFLVLN